MPITAYPPPTIPHLCGLHDDWIRQLQQAGSVAWQRYAGGAWGRVVLDGGATQLTLSTEGGPFAGVLCPVGSLSAEHPDILLSEDTLHLARAVLLDVEPSSYATGLDGKEYQCVLARAGQLYTVRLDEVT